MNVSQQGIIGRGHLKIGNQYYVGPMPAMGTQHHQRFGKGRTHIGTAVETTLQEVHQHREIGLQIAHQKGLDVFREVDDVTFP